MAEGTLEQTGIIIAIIVGVIVAAWFMLTFLEKILGFLLVIGGVLILLGFPDIGASYQSSHFWSSGKMVGLIMLAAGIALLALG